MGSDCRLVVGVFADLLQLSLGVLALLSLYFKVSTHPASLTYSAGSALGVFVSFQCLIVCTIVEMF